jgi:hypothetical protein
MLPYLTATGADRYDLVIGSRFTKDSSIAPSLPLMRRFTGGIGRALIRTFITRKGEDTGCGFKCYSAHAAETIFPIARMNGWALDTEIVALAERYKLRIKEVPVFWSYDTESHHRPVLANLREHLSLWFNLHSSRYPATSK